MMLHIRVVEAKDLPKMDVFGKCDPFCILQMSSAHAPYKTKVIERTFTPYWDQTFHLPIVSLVDDFLRISVRDMDKGNQDDPISHLDLHLSSFEIDKVIDKWYPLIPCEGVPKGGQIRLCCHICSSDGIAFKPGTGTPISGSTPTSPPPSAPPVQQPVQQPIQQPPVQQPIQQPGTNYQQPPPQGYGYPQQPPPPGYGYPQQPPPPGYGYPQQPPPGYPYPQ